MKIHNLSFDRAHSVIAYDPESGIFTWRHSQGKARAGAVVGAIQNGYRKATIDREQIRLHRLAWFMTHGVWPSGQIDHINGDKLDNKLSNLRDVSMSINMQNRYARRRQDSDLPQGVTRIPSGKFVANIRIGVFTTPEEAGEAYLRAKRLIHEGCAR